MKVPARGGVNRAMNEAPDAVNEKRTLVLELLGIERFIRGFVGLLYCR